MESFLFPIAQEVLMKLGSLALQEVSMAWTFKRDLKRLQETLSAVNAVVLDAEEQQVRNHLLTDWLGKLKEVLYDAEDVIDEFQIYIKHKKWVNRRRFKRKVRFFFSKSSPLAFPFIMGQKVKDIRQRLDDIVVDKNKFDLMGRFPNAPVVTQARDTYSFVGNSEVIGRDQERDDIVNILLNPCDVVLPVIPIVGFGGMGKTTLAKFVYNDDRVVRNFALRMWVCVSEDFNLQRLMRDIIRSATGGDYGDSRMEDLQHHLRSALNGKKFLLVLDDVWNLDHANWIALEGLLKGDADGSRIVVTTRKQAIASLMGTVPTHELKGLPYDDCLALFRKLAFKEGSDKQDPTLVQYGAEIVKKCNGVPLAVRTLGSLLCMNIDERYWKDVKDNEIWELEQKEGDILPALKLSYDELSFDLKRCFASCCIFPKNSRIDRDKLIHFWMANGLIQSTNDKKELEDIGMRHCDCLCSISFFQEVEQYVHILKEYTMHDLVHDLAVSVSKTEFAVVNCDTPSITKMVRHVFLSDLDLSDGGVPNSMLDLEKLRTIVKFKAHNKTLVDACTSNFKYLRFLDMSHSKFEVLSDSIGKLKHLRYLDLSNTRIKKLPNSICKLHHLQMLKLTSCTELEELPSDIGNLTNLQHLDVTTKQKRLPERGIRGLTSLRSLWLFGCENLDSLPEGIQSLTSLRTLVIWQCGSLTSMPSSMKYLSTLENLIFVECNHLDLTEWEGNLGLTSLRSFWVRYLPKLVALPRWLQGAASTMRELYIDRCDNLEALPEWLGNLAALQKLRIKQCNQLCALPEGMQRLTALQEIRIDNCKKLKGRIRRDGEDWHKIAHVQNIVIPETRHDAGCRLVAGCIPFKYKTCGQSRHSNGEKEVEVLMISTPIGKGLLFPKGGWENDETIEEAALREAFEEAGVQGYIQGFLGYYEFASKTHSEVLCKAAMFALFVKEELESWPEQRTRKRYWVNISEAAVSYRYKWMKDALDDFLKWHAKNTSDQ